eukprot:TRINITY_DN2453_c0_g1_i1.p2 TRINITY_DN2453_c0_g1~~TRINITY_DN2453_c0_g1_i1.p2  ORF type:complete len:181 (-),score=26.26 TRINITY_DN2453_c0_g1_i1:161-703(-)
MLVSTVREKVPAFLLYIDLEMLHHTQVDLEVIRIYAKTPSDNEDSNERQLDVNPPETYHFDSKTKRDKYRNTRNKSDTSLSSPPGSVKRKFSFSSEGSSDEKVYSIGRNRTVPQTRLRSSSVNETFAPTFSMEQYASKDTPLGRIKDKFKNYNKKILLKVTTITLMIMTTTIDARKITHK